MALTRLNWATTEKLNTILNNFMSQQVSVCVCVCVCVCVFIEAEWEFCYHVDKGENNG